MQDASGYFTYITVPSITIKLACDNSAELQLKQKCMLFALRLCSIFMIDTLFKYHCLPKTKSLVLLQLMSKKRENIEMFDLHNVTFTTVTSLSLPQETGYISLPAFMCFKDEKILQSACCTVLLIILH